MKLLISLIFIAVISMIIYSLLSRVFDHHKKHPHHGKLKKKPLALTMIAAVFLIGLLVVLMVRSALAPDLQCSSVHKTTTQPPMKLESASDYFSQGNYEYDTGNCKKAVADYSLSIMMNPFYAQAYNNRAYTLMRLRDYKNALNDLDQALAINPDYVQALMNRGDIRNYYYAINRQSAVNDYQKVISLGGGNSTSVCGHLLLAKHNGWNLGTIFEVPFALFNCK